MNTNTSERLSRAESSRINGSHSKGPRTPEGKQRSSYNRTTHGMRSSRVVLRNESQDTFDTLYSLFFDLFDPRDIFEHECIDNLVNARWRIRRLQAADTANIELAMEHSRSEFEKQYTNITPTHEHALAFRAIAETGGSDIIGRYEDRQHRVFERSYRLIARHRGKYGALPSYEDLREREATLPADNLPLPNRMETQPDTQNQTFEPETPPQPAPEPPPPLAAVPSEPKIATSKEPKEPRNPNFVYADEARLMEPLFEALANYPQLSQGVWDAIAEYNARKKSERAA